MINCKFFKKIIAIFLNLLYDRIVYKICKFRKYSKERGKQKMKKVASIIFLGIIILSIISIINPVYATEKVLDENTESKLVEIKENTAKSLEDYKQKYGSDTYGLVAYILNQVRIYSIPLCFLGIAIGAIHQYVIGIRKLDTLEKGMALIVTFVTILIICQILPLAFAVFVKFGRG